MIHTNRDIDILDRLFKEAADEQRQWLLLAAGIDPVPEHKRGSMYCCGQLVEDGERCPVCGSLNW